MRRTIINMLRVQRLYNNNDRKRLLLYYVLQDKKRLSFYPLLRIKDLFKDQEIMYKINEMGYTSLSYSILQILAIKM